MRPPFSIDSTKSLEGSFAGALNPVFTKLWGQDLRCDFTTASEPSFRILGPSTIAFGPARWSIRFEVQGTTSGIQDLGNLLNRTVCFALLSRVPNEGLPEVIESLRDAIEFYRSSETPTPRQLPAYTSRSAVKGKSLERAPLLLDDEG